MNTPMPLSELTETEKINPDLINGANLEIDS